LGWLLDWDSNWASCRRRSIWRNQYRRDGRKDQLLQENGYLVLRFLPEDVGRELDLVLDAFAGLSEILEVVTV
jgi:very-short-patch-repair endonuclease